MAPNSVVDDKCLQQELSYHEEELKVARSVEVSIDLVLAAKRQLGFLRTIDSITSLHCYGPAVLRAIQRYQNCWMPLAAEAEDLDSNTNELTEFALLPPVDVQWVWHCHCLSPMAYREFCKSRYGCVINCPLLPDSASEAAARERCRKLWTERYHEEPFDVGLISWGSTDEGASSAFPPEAFPEAEIADIVAVISRQSSFYYQVSQPYMWEEAFLQAALERYKCFLHIVNKSRGAIMCVPTYDIDLIWHAHQVSPVAYARDTKALLGCVVDHDDSMERGPHTKLGNSFEDTSRLWESTFGHPYERAGSMYRGSKPVNLPAPPHDGSDGQKILECEPVALSSEYGLRDINRTLPLLVPRRIVQSSTSGGTPGTTMGEPLWVHGYSKVWRLVVSYLQDKTLATSKLLRGLEVCTSERPPTSIPQSQPANVEQLGSRQRKWNLLVCILIRSAANVITAVKEKLNLFVRLRALQAHKLLKLDTPVVPFTANPQWQKLWHLHCEVATGGVALELRCRGEGCLSTLNQSKLIGSTVLTWENLRSSPMLSIDTMFTLKEKRWAVDKKKDPLQLRLGASITPPVQAPYLLKSVPDRVTDDSGAMLSNLILKMNKYQPQRGRWISRTVLNHMGKECFVIRIRVAKGVWRKNGDRPEGVEWNERVINVCEGSWGYVAGPTGYAPSRIVGSATPSADELEHYRLSWNLSTGATLVISRPLEEGNDWEHHLQFSLTGCSSNLVRLINGRKLQYEVPNATPLEEEGFVTLIRYNATTPQGKATALFNWKVSAMEIHPEEDVTLVLLLCTATMRSVADFGGKHHGNLFAQRRHKESKPGLKDWGSVVVEHAASQSNLATWYLNTAAAEDDSAGAASVVRHAGPMGGACGSSCGGDLGWGGAAATHAGWRQVTLEETSVATVGAWGRRTGSGIQLDSSRLPKKQ